MPHLPSSGRLGAGAPGGRGALLGVSKVCSCSGLCRSLCLPQALTSTGSPVLENTGMVTVRRVCLSLCCETTFQQCETLSPDIQKDIRCSASDASHMQAASEMVCDQVYPKKQFFRIG